MRIQIDGRSTPKRSFLKSPSASSKRCLSCVASSVEAEEWNPAAGDAWRRPLASAALARRALT